MEERDALAPLHVFAGSNPGQATCAPELTRLLALLAARQFVLPTARAMRTGTASTAPADRMVRLFAAYGRAGAAAGAGGAFNPGTARYLSGMHDDEATVYRGA